MPWSGVRIWRGRKRWTLEDLARKTGLGVAYLSKLERGNINPTIKTLERIAEALEVRLEDLFIKEHPDPAASPAPAEPYQITRLEGGIYAVTMAPLDPANALPNSLSVLEEAHREKSDQILVQPHTVNLTPEQRYRTARDAVAWLRGQGYQPQIVWVTDEEADRFGVEVVRDWGVEAACYPTEAEALRWLRRGIKGKL